MLAARGTQVWLTFLTAFLACSSDSHSISGELTPVASISVSPPNGAGNIGAGVTFSAVALDKNHAPIDGWTLAWGSSNNSIATVSSTGTATGISAGRVTISAAADGQTGSAILTVIDPTAPASLVVQTEPAGGLSGVSLPTQPVVEILDGTGAVAAAATLPVTATITSGAGVMIGTTTVNAVAGLATFANLQITGSGDFAIAFSTASPALQVVSDSFSVQPVTVTEIFQDGFETGDFSHTENGVKWSSTTYVDVSSSIAHNGTQAARFREGDSHNDSELDFDGLANLPDVYMQYYLYLPTGTESPSVGPEAKITGTINDKFFRLWGGGAAGYNYGAGNVANPYGNKIGASTWGDGSGVNGRLGGEFEWSQPGSVAPNQWAMAEIGNGNQPGANQYYQFFSDANRGRWVQVRIHCKQASTANNDGMLQIWIDGVLVISWPRLQDGNIYGAAGPFGYTTGYILGFANNGWPPGQYVYLDDFVITTGSFGPP